MHWRILALIFISLVPDACGHAVLRKPRARNFVAHEDGSGACSGNSYGEGYKPGCKENDQASLNAWGIGDRRKGTWPSPVGSFGLCGDPVQLRGWTTIDKQPYMIPTEPQATYTEGDIVEFEIGGPGFVEHHGHYEFRVCDKPLDGRELAKNGGAQAGQDCLDKWILKRAPPAASGEDSAPIDELHPGRWHVGAAGGRNQVNAMNESNPGDSPDWNDLDVKPYEGPAILNSGDTKYKMRYILPEGLSCEKCTLQYYWPTANTCCLDDDVAKYWKQLGREPPTHWTGKNACKSGSNYGEEFWNCADITIKPKKNTEPSPRRRDGGGGVTGRRRRRSSSRSRSSRSRSSRRRRRTSSRSRSSRRRRRRSSRSRSTRRRRRRRRRAR